MVILHVAAIPKTLFTGVAVAVPQHVRAQQGIGETVALVNLFNVEIEGIQNQFPYGKDFALSRLPAPFNAPDLIVFHEVYRPAFLKLYRQAKMMGIPYVIIPHGCMTRVAQKKKWWKKIPANFFLFNAFINGAAAIQYLSAQERMNSCRNCGGFVGSNGVFMPAKKKSIFHPEALKIVYIGRMEVQIKGLDLMLQAVKLIDKELQARMVRICLYGPECENSYVELSQAIRQYLIEELVELHDVIGGKEKENELLTAALFMQTSRSEGMSMGILEALSYGLPCLVTRGTNLGEIIEEYDAGWVAETDARSVADTLLKALDERDRWAEKSNNAVKLIEENYQWSKVAEATLEEYKKLLN